MTELSSTELVSRHGCIEKIPGSGAPGSGAPGAGASDAISFSGVAPLNMAAVEHLSFLTNEKYEADALTSNAGGILCSALSASRLDGKVQSRLFVCAEPYVVFARISQFFFKPQHPFRGISEHAVIDSSAQIDPTATIFPFVFVGPGAVIGPRTFLYSGVFVGAASSVGEDCIVYPNVVIREGCTVGARCVLNAGAVVGGEGFGFAPSGMENVKIPQVGGVRLEDDVEVGANSSIDRGALLDTFVGAQTKIDSLVQIGHNVVVGKACFLAGQVGIAGSTKIGDRVTLAGQVGVGGHLQIGDFITVLGKAGVTKSLVQKGVYNGNPAKPNRDHLREKATVSRLAKSRAAKDNDDKE